MFSGLVREIAKVKGFSNHILRLQSSYKPKIGDSIAVNGVCLTTIELLNDGFCLELSAHTQESIAVENLKDAVHIEPALQMSDRFDGHFVQGHIDGIGVLTKIQKVANQVHFHIQPPPHLSPFIIPKGSITIDGISLTISDFSNHLLLLTLIPHTFSNTLFKSYTPNRRVNIETDMFVRSIAHLLQKTRPKETWERLDSLALGY